MLSSKAAEQTKALTPGGDGRLGSGGDRGVAGAGRGLIPLKVSLRSWPGGCGSSEQVSLCSSSDDEGFRGRSSWPVQRGRIIVLAEEKPNARLSLHSDIFAHTHIYILMRRNIPIVTRAC